MHAVPTVNAINLMFLTLVLKTKVRNMMADRKSYVTFMLNKIVVDEEVSQVDELLNDFL